MYDKPAIRENGWFFLFAVAEPLPAEKRMQKKKSHARGEAYGERAMAVIQPCKGRRATPEARPTEKEKET